MMDNYVTRKEFNGLTQSEDGQVVFVGNETPAEKLIPIAPIEEESRGNGAGVEKRGRRRTKEA